VERTPRLPLGGTISRAPEPIVPGPMMSDVASASGGGDVFKRILVGLDGTSHGLRTAAAAAGLAGRFGAELHVLTVAKPHEVTPAVQDYLEAENLLGEPSYVLDEETQTIVDKAKALAEQNKVRKIRTVVREGRPAVVLVDYAKDHQMDLLVVGSRGLGALEAALLGSVSQKVSQLAGCSVLIVR
jgi:nucleotide-binding universal stress UspA family protein